MITANVDQGSARVDGLRIAYESVGEGDPPVVFVHGIFANRTYFAQQVQHLAPRHLVIGVDLRSHGESDDSATATVEDFQRDVIAVLERAHAGPAVLCGHSVLGGVALSIGASRPDLVRGVVMLDGVVFFPEGVRQMTVRSLLPALAGDSWLDPLRAYVGRLIDPAPPAVAARIGADVSRARREIALSFFESVFGSDYEPRQQRYAEALAALRCPLMYVRAKSPANVGRIQELRPEVMVGQVVGSGHYMMLSAAEQLNAMLDRFLETTV